MASLKSSDLVESTIGKAGSFTPPLSRTPGAAAITCSALVAMPGANPVMPRSWMWASTVGSLTCTIPSGMTVTGVVVEAANLPGWKSYYWPCRHWVNREFTRQTHLRGEHPEALSHKPSLSLIP